MLEDFMETTWYKIIFIIVSILAGLSMLISPENTPMLLLRIVGFIWILEGFFMIPKLKKQKN